MAKGSTYGNLLRPSGQQHMDMFGSSESALAKFLYPLRWRDTTFVFDDFTGAALNTHLWTAAKIASNGTDFDPPSTQLVGGVCQGVTGAVAGDHVNLRSDAVWLGDNNCGLEIRLKVDNIDDAQWEVGFTDPLTGYTATASSIINDIDTPTITNGATDVALVGQDTGQTLTTMAFITDGSTTNMNTTKTNLGTRTPTNATYMVVRVQLAQTASAVAAAHGYVLDENDAILEEAQHGSALANQIKGNVLLESRIYWEALTTSARTVDLDYIAIWADRGR